MKATEVVLIVGLILGPGMLVMAVGFVLRRSTRSFEVHLVTETVIPALAVGVMIAMAILVSARVIV